MKKITKKQPAPKLTIRGAKVVLKPVKICIMESDIGKKIWSSIMGWGTIMHVDSTPLNQYSGVRVSFDATVRCVRGYSSAGKVSSIDLYPELQWTSLWEGK